MAIFIPGITCLLCGKPVLSAAEAVTFCPFVGDRADPLFVFSDAVVHVSCFARHPLSAEATRWHDEALRHRKVADQPCSACGRPVVDPDDFFATGLLTRAPDNPFLPAVLKMGTPQVYDPAEWSRAGRGRELQFFATDADVRRWLDHLPDQYAPYMTWGSRLVKRAGDYGPMLFCYPLNQWGRGVVETPEQFFLHTSALMPPLPKHAETAQSANEWASLNGLVLVQHGASREGKRLESRLAVTDKIKNRVTGNIVSLRDRAVVFDTLRMMVKSDLCFTSIQVFKDGHEEEDDTQMMTADAAELAAKGYFVRRAGRPVKGKSSS